MAAYLVMVRRPAWAINRSIKTVSLHEASDFDRERNKWRKAYRKGRMVAVRLTTAPPKKKLFLKNV